MLILIVLRIYVETSMYEHGYMISANVYKYNDNNNDNNDYDNNI